MMVKIQNYRGEKLVGILHETGSKEIVIICHGLRSSKDCIPMVTLAARIENIGISAFRFDLTGNGESEGLPPGFGNLNREIEDLRAVIQHFRHIGRVITTIIGHSKGGIMVLLYASRYNDVHSIVNISSCSDLPRIFRRFLGKDFLERLKRDGFCDVYNRRGEFRYRLSEESLKDDLKTDIQAACRSIHEHIRVLTVHGTKDLLMPITDAFELDKLIPNHMLRIVEGANHDYTHHQNELATIIVDFVRKNTVNLPKL